MNNSQNVMERNVQQKETNEHKMYKILISYSIDFSKVHNLDVNSTFNRSFITLKNITNLLIENCKTFRETISIYLFV